jgi:hypothetical protein
LRCRLQRKRKCKNERKAQPLSVILKHIQYAFPNERLAKKNNIKDQKIKSCEKTIMQRNGDNIMANNTLVPEAKAALEDFKMQAANEVGVTLNKNGYNGDLTARQAGSIGGQMVKKMVESYENSLKTK